MAMRPLDDLDLEAHLRDPAIKQRFVTRMFDVVAPRYDRFTQAFSFGLDGAWKAEMIRLLRPAIPPDAAILDAACGTGDLALAAAGLVPRGRVTGVDASAQMIAHARRRPLPPGTGRVSFLVADLLRLPHRDASVAAVTVGYGIRNTPDYESAVSEIARVLMPGGCLISLDFFLPESALWRRLFLWYLAAAGRAYGWLWHRAPVVYGYIARSLEHYMTVGEMSLLLRDRGFAVRAVQRHLGGGIGIHMAERAP